MSLKGFHILFITFATLLCIAVVLWAFVLEARAGNGLQLLGILGAIAAILLPIYGVRFYRKVKTIEV